jgi:hypothetical protein
MKATINGITFEWTPAEMHHLILYYKYHIEEYDFDVNNCDYPLEYIIGKIDKILNWQKIPKGWTNKTLTQVIEESIKVK